MSLMDYRKGKNPLLVSVELHRHGAEETVVFHNGNTVEHLPVGGGSIRQITNCLFETISWSHSTTPPYENLRMTMRFRGNVGDSHFEKEMKGPGNSAAGLPIPQVNDWIVVRTFDRVDAKNLKPEMQTVFLARIHKTRGEHRADAATGVVDKSAVHIEAEGFLDFLGKTNVCVGFVPTRGTLYNHKDWKLLLTELLSEIFSSDFKGIVGNRFTKLFKAVSRIRLPQTLNKNRFISDSVTVVFNQSQSNKVSGGRFRRNVEPVPGYRLNGINSLDVTRSTSLDLLLGSFLADPSMMEIFPSIEFGYDNPSKKGVDKTLNGMSGLNARLCIIVRMKPWRPEPVQKFALRAASLVTNVSQIASGAYNTESFKNAVKAKAENMALSTPGQSVTIIEDGTPVGKKGSGITDAMIEQAQVEAFNELADIGPNLRSEFFNKATWPESANAIGKEKMHFIETSEVYSLTYEQNDAAHVNTVTATVLRQPNSQLEFASSFMGLPYTNTTDIEEFGVRFYKPEWPFTHIKFNKNQKKESSENSDEKSFVRTVAAAALQIHAAGSRFFTGQLTVHYRPDIRVGMCFRAGNEMTPSATENDFTNEAFSPGGYLQGGQLIAYVEKVTHEIVSGPIGRSRAQTVINYTRGLFN